MFSERKRLEICGVPTLEEFDSVPATRSGHFDEVLLHNGELVVTQTDFSLPARAGLGFSLVRTYRSHVDYAGPLGYGWDHNHNQRLAADTTSLNTATTIKWWNGTREITFTSKKDKESVTWVPDHGAFYKLHTEGEMVFIDAASGLRYNFAKAAVKDPQNRMLFRISRIATPHENYKKNFLDYSYASGTDTLTKVSDPYGRVVKFHYDNQGLISNVSCGDISMDYAYNDNNLSASSMKKIIMDTKGAPIDLTTKYSYKLEDRPWLIGRTLPGERCEVRINYNFEQSNENYGRVVSQKLIGKDVPDDKNPAYTFDHLFNRLKNLHTITVGRPSPYSRLLFSFPNIRDMGNILGRYPISMEIQGRDAKWTYKTNEDGLVIAEGAPLGGRIERVYDAGNSDARMRGNMLSETQFPRLNAETHGIKSVVKTFEYAKGSSVMTNQKVEEEKESKNILSQNMAAVDANLDTVKTMNGDMRVNQSVWIIRNAFGLTAAIINGLGVVTIYRYLDLAECAAEQDNRTAIKALSPANGGMLSEIVEDVSPEEAQRELAKAGLVWSKDIPLRKVNASPVQRLTVYRYDNYGNRIASECDGRSTRSLYNKLGHCLAQYDSTVDFTLHSYAPTGLCITSARRVSTPKTPPANIYPGEIIEGFKGRFVVESFVRDSFGETITWTKTKEKFILNRPSDYSIKVDLSMNNPFILQKNIEPTISVMKFYQSAKIGSSNASSMTIKCDSETGGELSFDFMIDSERGDELYIDSNVFQEGRQSEKWGSSYKKKIQRGTSSIVVEYKKDAYTSHGEDCVKIWNIQFTPDAQNLNSLGTSTYCFRRLPSGKMDQMVSPTGKTLSLVYDPVDGNLKQKLLFPSGMTADIDQAYKALTLESEMNYDKEGFLTSKKDDAGEVWQYSPDAFGRPYKTIAPDGTATTYKMDGLGRQCSTLINDKSLTPLSKINADYDICGRVITEKTLQVPISNVKSENETMLTSAQNYYDDAGRLIRYWKFREAAAESIDYDGLGRQVLRVNGVGDAIYTLYRQSIPVLTRSIFFKSDDKTSVEMNNVTLLDDRCRPYAQIPAGKNIESLSTGRASISFMDTAGRVISSVALSDAADTQNPGALLPRLTTKNCYDSLGNIVSRMDEPRQGDGSRARQTTMGYDSESNLLFTRIENQAIYFSQSGGLPKPDYVSIPQLVKNEYDAFGRLTKTVQPDGLVHARQYKGTLLNSLTLSRRNSSHVFMFTYDKMRRIVAVDGKKEDKIEPLQTFEYDSIGNIVKAVEKDQLATVETMREFDTMGNTLSEKIRFDGSDVLPGSESNVTYMYDYITGIRTTRTDTDGKNNWSLVERLHDKTGRLVAINLDGKTLAEYTNLGSQTASVSVPEGGFKKTMEFSPFMEQQGIHFEGVNAECNYMLDQCGLPEAMSFKLNSPLAERTTFYKHDDFGQLSAEGAVDKFYADRKDALLKRKDALDDSNNPILYSRMTLNCFDEVMNLTKTFRRFGKENTQAIENLKNKSAVHYSSSNITDGVLNDDAKLQLASNRLGATASFDYIGEKFEYDFRGQLKKYLAVDEGKEAEWRLEFNMMGRLTRAKKLINPGDKEKLAMTLDFIYDAFGRRVIKKKTDVSHTVTTALRFNYAGGQIATVDRSSIDEGWQLDSQYLWGRTGEELIMAVLKRSSVEDASTKGTARYFFHQDRGLNVIVCTGAKGGNSTPKVYDTASYLGFGENCTSARVSAVNSNLPVLTGNNPQTTIDRSLDKTCNWLQQDGPGYIQLSLDKPASMSQITIWTSAFPKTFKVYAIPPGKPGPADKPAWDAMDKTAILAASVDDGKFRRGMVEFVKQNNIGFPYEISLGGHIGNRLAICWDKTEQLTVSAFELSIKPKNPGSVAFAGEWLDAETGLYYHEARYRLPSMGGKFISPDPLGFFAGVNLYAYANNDPLTWHDPDGRFANVLVGAGIGAVAGTGAYFYEMYRSGEKFKWGKLGIYAGSGTAAGAVAGATFGASIAVMGSGTGAVIASGAVSGAAAGATGGFTRETAMGLYNGQSFGNSLASGGKAAAIEGALGAVGGAAAGGALAGMNSAIITGNVWANAGKAVASGVAQ